MKKRQLEHGAKQIPNSNGNDARGLAHKWGHAGVLRLLESAGESAAAEGELQP